MEKKSLRATAKELGVSHSYLSQVTDGKRPAGEKVLTTLLTTGLIGSPFSAYNEHNAPVAQRIEQRFPNREPEVSSHRVPYRLV